MILQTQGTHTQLIINYTQKVLILNELKDLKNILTASCVGLPKYLCVLRINGDNLFDDFWGKLLNFVDICSYLWKSLKLFFKCLNWYYHFNRNTHANKKQTNELITVQIFFCSNFYLSYHIPFKHASNSWIS